MWSNGNPHVLLVGMQTGAATVESSMELPQKIEWDCLMTQCSTSGNISEEARNTDSKEYTHPYAYYSAIYSS